jgi:capsular exopolysaccharide synthesis family protein
VATENRHVSPTDGTIVPSLLDYLRVLGRRKFLFLLIVILVPATAVAVSLNQEPTYQASAVVYLQPQALGTASDPERVAQTQAELAQSPAVLDKVLDAVPGAGLDREEFLESSSVSATLGRDILTFSVEHSDPQLARQLATEYAKAFTEFREQLDTQELSNTLAQVRQRLAELEANGEGPGSPNYDALERQEENLVAAGAAASQAQSARVVTPAGEAPKVGPRTVRNGLIAFCLGLVLALVVVFLADALDTRVRSVDSIREALGLPLLGRLPAPPSRLRKDNGLVMLADPTSPEAEPYRVLRASLEFANADHSFRTIMITSAVDAEGKSTTVANLAVTLARAGRRVILIDADLSSPHLHRLFGLDERPGLTDLDLGDTRLEEALRPIGLKGEASEADHVSRRMDRTGSLEVLPGGSTLQDKLGFENAVGRIIHRVRDRVDIVLVDAPPLLLGDAIALSAHVDAVVVVARLKALRMSTLQDMSRILEASPATKLGFIVTGVDQSSRYRQHQRYADSQRRPEGKPRLTLTVPPSPADGDDGVPAGGSSNETAGESETEGRGDQPAPSTPADSRSKPAPKPFGGLSPSEAGKRSWEIRRAKSAQRADAPESPFDATQDGLKDA